jgi:hypothetical protein
MRRMLKKFRYLTHPTPARQDAPFRRQGRSDLSLIKGGLVDPRVRASNEHILIVRVARARGSSQLPRLPFQHPVV